MPNPSFLIRIARERAGSTDRQLINRLSNSHDREAWERFTELYGPVIEKWCRKNQLLPQDAEDTTQEVLRTVSASVLKWDSSKGAFRAWLYTVTKHLAITLLKKNQRRTEMLKQLNQQVDDEMMSASFDQLSRRQFLAAAMKRVQAEFEPRSWNAFLKSYLEGQSPAKVAEELNMSVGAVYIARSRILARIRDEVDKISDVTTRGDGLSN